MFKVQEAQLPLRERRQRRANVSSYSREFVSSWISLYVTCGIFSRPTWSARRTSRLNLVWRVLFKESSQLSAQKEQHRHKRESMLNISVVSFYDNSCLTFKGSKDMATTGIESWPLTTTPLLLLTPPRARTLHGEYPHSPYIAGNWVPGEHFCRWQCASKYRT